MVDSYPPFDHKETAMKKIIAMLVMIAAAIGALLMIDRTVPLLDDYAKKLGDPTLLVRADGTVWRVQEVEGKGWTAELEYTLKDGSVCLPQIDGSDTGKMSALEYHLYRYRSIDKESWAVSGDGSIWRIYPDRKSPEMCAYKFATAEIPAGQVCEEFAVAELSIEEVLRYGEEYSVLNVWLRDGSGTLINPTCMEIHTLIDGVWYKTYFDNSDTLDVKLFDPNGEYCRCVGLQWISNDYTESKEWPAGHYRIMGTAYRYDPDDGYAWIQVFTDENRVYTPPVEFDLIYKNGEYKIKNIKN